MKTPEAELKDRVKTLLNALAPELFYWMPVPTGYGVRGIPDFVGCYRGYFFAIETKSPHGKVNPWQGRIHELIIKSGGYICVARTENEVISFLNKIKNAV